MVCADGDDDQPDDNEQRLARPVLHQARRQARVLLTARLTCATGELNCRERKGEVDDGQAQSLQPVEERRRVLLSLGIAPITRLGGVWSDDGLGQTPQRHGHEGHRGKPQHELAARVLCEGSECAGLIGAATGTECQPEDDVGDQQMQQSAHDVPGSRQAFEGGAVRGPIDGAGN